MPWSRALRRKWPLLERKENTRKRAYYIKSVATGDGFFIRGDDMAPGGEDEEEEKEEVAADVADFGEPERLYACDKARGDAWRGKGI